ncbi:mast cell carboxypeptidase A-like [Tropilaelaps mercedesae]|uniref:Mast cell carboxypeptidase A-like n=1 Tax=Tropilaelaps mercedesae TaxID=418985 RepID=A0A1V9X8G9_9ACAR|nr:mast cell carboxypeptidase A-like [Tropilaelaps mercedesae]
MFALVVAALGIFAAVAVPFEAPANFTNHRLIAAKLPTLNAFSVAQALSLDGRLELWSDLPGRDGSILFSISPEFFNDVDGVLKQADIETKVLETDLQRIIDEERLTTTYGFYINRAFNLHQFESYTQIVASISYYANGPHSLGRISSFAIGETHEKRQIVGIKIANSMERKPVIFIECGMHAREWASISTCLYMIDELVTNQESHKDLLDRFNFHIVPCSNPDGYEYTRNFNRLWRKNRSPRVFGGWQNCVGVDLNRNFMAGPHCGVGTEKRPCSDVFCGSRPFSEPETAALRDYLTSITDDVDYYVSLHAFGLMWMFPHSYTTKECPDHDELLARASIGVNAIKKKTGTVYTYGPIAKTIYPVTGSSVDWAYDELKIKKSFVLEVQPSLSNAFNGRGFLLQPSQIIPVGEETFTGLKAMWLS